MLALAACPHRIAEAHAWVNLMPGPLQGPRDLHVAIRLKDPNDNAVLLKVDDARPGRSRRGDLVLELRAAPVSAQPGEVSYRQPAVDASTGSWPTRISILCRGGEIYAITEIVAAR